MTVLQQAARATLNGERVFLFPRLPDGLHAACIGGAWIGHAPCFEIAEALGKNLRLPATVETPDGRVFPQSGEALAPR